MEFDDKSPRGAWAEHMAWMKSVEPLRGKRKDGRTHYKNCHQAHHDCAIRKVNAQKAEIERLWDALYLYGECLPNCQNDMSQYGPDARCTCGYEDALLASGITSDE